jgi:hypothetical protein
VVFTGGYVEKETDTMHPRPPSDASPGEQVHYLHPTQVKLLAPNHTLLISSIEQMVTLYGEAHRVLAIGRLTEYAFRVFVLLLLAPAGASYAELYAGLKCSKTCLEELILHATLRVPAFQEEVKISQALLATLTRSARQIEIKQVRRAIKGPVGLSEMLRSKPFGWRVQTLHRKGYLLVQQERNGGKV